MPFDTGKEGGKLTGQRMTHYIINDGIFESAYNDFFSNIYIYSGNHVRFKKRKEKLLRKKIKLSIHALNVG